MGKREDNRLLVVVGTLLGAVVLVGAVLAWRETWWAFSDEAWRFDDRVAARGVDRYLVAVLGPVLAVTLVPRWARGFLDAAEERTGPGGSSPGTSNGTSSTRSSRLRVARRVIFWVATVGALGALPAVGLSFGIAHDAAGRTPSLGTSLAIAAILTLTLWILFSPLLCLLGQPVLGALPGLRGTLAALVPGALQRLLVQTMVLTIGFWGLAADVGSPGYRRLTVGLGIRDAGATWWMVALLVVHLGLIALHQVISRRSVREISGASHGRHQDVDVDEAVAIELPVHPFGIVLLVLVVILHAVVAALDLLGGGGLTAYHVVAGVLLLAGLPLMVLIRRRSGGGLPYVPFVGVD